VSSRSATDRTNTALNTESKQRVFRGNPVVINRGGNDNAAQTQVQTQPRSEQRQTAASRTGITEPAKTTVTAPVQNENRTANAINLTPTGKTAPEIAKTETSRNAKNSGRTDRMDRIGQKRSGPEISKDSAMTQTRDGRDTGNRNGFNKDTKIARDGRPGTDGQRVETFAGDRGERQFNGGHDGERNSRFASNRAFTASGRTRFVNNTTVINNRTIVVNSNRGNYHNWHYGDHHFGNWWHPAPRHHHDGLFVSVSLGYHYRYCSWAPIVYEPVYTPIWNPVVVYDPFLYDPVYAPVAVESSYIAGYAPVWPSYRRTVFYGYGPSYTVSYVYPSYHRRYVFVSVGGYWPGYTYQRYYWYGCHPYVWYGAEPTPVIVENTTNVYTYTPGPLVAGSYYAGVQVPDYDGLAAIGQKINTQAAQEPAVPPQNTSETDKLFDEAVKAFESQDYAGAAEKLRTAVRMEPNDVVLPFAYAQTLFAMTEYEKAAAVLYTALTEMGPKKQDVFYPRGLYKDEAVLDGQIKNLQRAVLMDPQNAEMQLLLGYQLLGTGKYDEAKAPLNAAARNARTATPAQALISLLDRVKK
jgi:Tfp pilus assembly protein PilF